MKVVIDNIQKLVKMPGTEVMEYITVKKIELDGHILEIKDVLRQLGLEDKNE